MMNTNEVTLVKYTSGKIEYLFKGKRYTRLEWAEFLEGQEELRKKTEELLKEK